MIDHRVFISCLLTIVASTSAAHAQVGNPGPSPSTLFDSSVALPFFVGPTQISMLGGEFSNTQINIGQAGSLAADSEIDSLSEVNIIGGNISDNFFASGFSEVNLFSGGIGSGFNVTQGQVNIMGGSIGAAFDANSGSEIKITGGSVGFNFNAFVGSIVNIGGGSFGNNFDANPGSTVNLSGGSVGSDFDAVPGSNLEISGGEFLLNGAVFSGSSLTLAAGQTFSGTLADGSAFIFSALVGDELNDVRLNTTALPAVYTNLITVDTPLLGDPSGLRAGQTLTLQAGGELPPNFAAVGATLDIEGGRVGSFGEAADGAVVNLRGGEIGGGFDAFSGSTINVSGGVIGNSFAARSGSAVTVSGGVIGSGFEVFPGSDTQLIGSEFRLDGAAFTGDSVTLGSAQVLSGTLADGSVFILSPQAGDTISGVTLTPSTTPLLPADPTPVIVNTPSGGGPSGLRSGQTLTVVAGGELNDNFAAVNAFLNIEGGAIGNGLEAVESVVNISGGIVENSFGVFAGSIVNISGGIGRT